MFTLLFTAVGRRVELIQTFRDSYQKHGIIARLIGVDLEPEFAPAGQFLDQVFRVPPVDHADYNSTLLSICARENVDMLIPLYEPEFLQLDAERERFADIGTILLLSAKNALELCRDKFLTYQYFKQIGLKTPDTKLDLLSEPIQYPVMAKPRFGMGSIGVQVIESETAISEISQKKDMIFQKYIKGKEYTLDIFCDENGKVISVIPRERLEVRAGEVIKARTVYREDLIKEGESIAAQLGAYGPINIQCIAFENQFFWIEINPRFGGGVPLSYYAGMDYPLFIYQTATHVPIKPIIGEYQTDLLILRYDQSIVKRIKGC